MTRTIIISGLSLLLSLSACSGAGHSNDQDLAACSNFADAVYLEDTDTMSGRAEITRAILAYDGPSDPDLLKLHDTLVSLVPKQSWRTSARNFAHRCDALSIEREWGSRWSGVQTDRL